MTEPSRLRALAGLSPLLFLLLPSCTVGPDYNPPVFPAPPEWTSPLGSSMTADQAVEASLSTWWTHLNDPVLDDFIARAMQNNKDLRIAAARVREARELAIVAGATGLPQVDANGTALRQGFSRNTDQGRFTPERDTTLFQAGFDATWELDIFGQTRRSIEAALADVDAAQEARRGVIVSLLAEVARSYVELRGFQERLRIAQQNITSQQGTLDLAKARFEAGLRSELDVAQAQTQLSLTTAQIPVLQVGARQAMHRLAVLLGEAPGSLVAQLDTPGPIPAATAETFAVGLPSDLLRRRPDIRQAERELAASNARIGVATADLFPKFSLVGGLGLQSEHLNDLPNARSGYWSIGPALRWPIFSGGRIRANIDAATARQEAAASQYESAVLTALRDAEDSLIAFDRELARRDTLKLAVQASIRAFDLSNELYTRGLTDFQRVLDAQRSLYAAQDQLVQSEQLVTANLVAIYKALGGGWQSFDPQPEPPAPLSRESAASPPKMP